MSPAALTDFIDDLGKYRLLEPRQLEEVVRLQASFPDARGLARELLQRGWISAYQANLVLTGRGPALLLGSYVLIERIGEGGMGQVFKARNWKLGKVVALKVIRKDRLNNPIAVRRFEREIRAAAGLHHVNVVQTIDADEVQDTHLMIMELVEGGRDLNQLVKEQGPLPVAQACDFIRQAALGLQHAFERGMVHRDIKPHNLLVNSDNVLKILDMGLARVLAEEDGDRSSQLTMENTVMGTPDYIAPEQALDPHRADIRADLYSLGCVFFYLLTGRVPFGGDTLTEKLLKHQTDPPPKVEELRPEVPAVIGKVMRKLLAKLPEDRYQTPAQLAEVLQAFLTGKPVQLDVADSPSASIPMAAANPFSDLGTDERIDTVSEAPSPLAHKRQRRMFWLGGAVAACVIGLVLVIALLQRKGPDPGPPAAGKVKVVVEPSSRWQDTGIDLEADTTVNVTVQGKLKKKDWPESSPGGLESQTRDRTLLFDAPPLCLLGRIGEHAPFPLGNVASIKPKEAGRLFVQVNDLDLREVSGRFTLEMNPARRSATLGKRPTPVRLQSAEMALETLPANLAHSQANPVDLARQVQDFREKYAGTPAAARANLVWHAYLAGLPSPLDNLEPRGPSTDSRDFWQELDQPKEVVAILGQQGAGPVKSLAFSHDKRLLLWAVEEKTRLFDILSNKQLQAYNTDKKMLALALSPRMDTALAASQADDLPLWNPQTGKEVGKLTGHKGAATGVLLSFDGKQAWSSSQDGTVRLWDVAARKELRRWEGFKGTVLGIALSPDSRVLAAACQDLTLHFWNPDLASGEEVVVKGYPSPVSALAFSPDGWTLATGHANGQIKFMDLAQKEPKEKEIGLAIGGNNPVLAYSPDGRWLLAGSQSGALILWEAATTKMLWEWKLPGPIISLAFAADSRHVALGLGNGSVVLFRLGLAPANPELAEPAWQKLLARAADPGADKEKLLRDLARFRGRFAGSPQADKAAEFFWKFPSPLDRLDAANIPDLERLDWQPKELVAVLGSHRLRHQATVVRVALTPDGKRLATATSTGDIVVWDAATGKERNRLGSMEGDILALAFHKDGQLLAAGARNGIAKLFNVVNGKTVRTLKEKTPMALAFSPDGKLLATSHGADIVLRDVEDWKVVQTLKGQKDEILSLAFSADGEALATGSQAGAIRLWDVNQAKPMKTLAQKEGPVLALAFHPEKKLLASAADKVKLWDTAADTVQKTWQGGQAVAFNKSGKLLAFANGTAIKLWDLADAELTELIGHIRPVHSLVFATDGTELASGSEDETCRLWNPAIGKETIPIRSYSAFPISFSPDGRALVSCGQYFHGPQIWDLTTYPLKARTFVPQSYMVDSLAFSLNGETLASGQPGDNRLLLWDVARPGQYLQALGHKGGIMQTAFSPDGRKVATCGTDNTILFWDPFTGKQLGAPLVGPSVGINCIAYSPDGRLLATGSNDGTARLLDLRSGNTVHTFNEHGKAAIAAVAVSKDGALLATLGTDSKVNILELAKRKVRITVDAPPGTMYWALAVSPDNKMLATSSDKGAIYLWDLPTAKKLKEWQFPFQTKQVAFAPDTRHLAVALGNGTVYILRLDKMTD